MKNNQGKLFIVGTPIGNLSDISERAIETLRNVDIIACEDTRKAKTLQNAYNIPGKLIIHQAHNETKSTPGIIKLLKGGKNIAVITDSGMPVISDPGGHLIRQVREEGIEIDIIPGPTALTTAIALAGLGAPYIFAGFAPATPKKQRRMLRNYKAIDCPIVLYEAPHKINRFVVEIEKILGNREIIIARELTKIYQELLRFEVEDFIEKKPKLKGEIVLIILPEKIEIQEDLPFI